MGAMGGGEGSWQKKVRQGGCGGDHLRDGGGDGAAFDGGQGVMGGEEGSRQKKVRQGGCGGDHLGDGGGDGAAFDGGEGVMSLGDSGGDGVGVDGGEGAAAAARRDPLVVLGPDIFSRILALLDARSVARSVVVSHLWQMVTASDRLWEPMVSRLFCSERGVGG